MQASCVLLYIYIYILFGYLFDLQTHISISEIQVPLFMATYFGIKYHLQAISNVYQQLGSKIIKN
jgi:hypothetical protein